MHYTMRTRLREPFISPIENKNVDMRSFYTPKYPYTNVFKREFHIMIKQQQSIKLNLPIPSGMVSSSIRLILLVLFFFSHPRLPAPTPRLPAPSSHPSSPRSRFSCLSPHY